MSVTITPAPASRRYHRDQNGLKIEYFQIFDPAKSYRHYVEENTEGDVLSITTFCGTTRAPIAEDFLSPPLQRRPARLPALLQRVHPPALTTAPAESRAAPVPIR